ncbi:unnamed protein product, partial [Symbiodinium sp. KB8]
AGQPQTHRAGGGGSRPEPGRGRHSSGDASGVRRGTERWQSWPSGAMSAEVHLQGARTM